MKLKNFFFIVASCLILFFATCSMKKVMNVKIENKNNYPISFTIKANNIIKSFSLKPSETIIDKLDWTELKNEEAEVTVDITNQNTKEVTNYTYQQPIHGELSNYFDATVDGSQLKMVFTD